MKRKSKERPHKKLKIQETMTKINLDAAGIDIGHREHWCAVPAERDAQPVQRFGTFTEDLEKMADWLKGCGIKTVAMESTGVYWIPAFQILERRGLEVRLVNARHAKNVSGRKSDILDCQWLQQLHSYGLLNGSFRPSDELCVLRSYLRYRDELVCARSTQCQHLQKALQQMNVQLHQVLSDVTGVSGLRIIEAILNGERDPGRLASLAHRRVRASTLTIAKAMRGDWGRSLRKFRACERVQTHPIRGRAAFIFLANEEWHPGGGVPERGGVFNRAGRGRVLGCR